MCTDGGSDVNILLPKVANKLRKAPEVTIRRLNDPFECNTAVQNEQDGIRVKLVCKETAVINKIEMDGRHGYVLTLRNSEWMIPN